MRIKNVIMTKTDRRKAKILDQIEVICFLFSDTNEAMRLIEAKTDRKIYSR